MRSIMKSENIKILAIESSCDETAASVIQGCHPEFISGSRNKFGMTTILSNVVSSQVDLHALTGGVVPEVASRAHVEAIVLVISEALIAARNFCHPEFISGSQKEMLKQVQHDAHVDFQEAIKIIQNEIDYIAVTAGPGLIGSLLVGFNAAKTLAYALDKQIVPINHIEGHIYSAFGRIEETITKKQVTTCLPVGRDTNKSQITNSKLNELDDLMNFPLLALTVSGGHTSLTLMHDHGKYETLGETIDDAAGEAFDKVAKLLDLGYPGGPVVSKLASQFRDNLKFKISNLKSSPNDQMINDKFIENCKPARSSGGLKIENSPKGIIFPRPILNNGTYNFSFSGLKTAVLQRVIDLKKKHGEDLSDEIKQEVCAAFEDAVVDVLVTKTMRAVDKHKPKAVILAGGVAANRRLREVLQLAIETKKSVKFLVPPMNLCGDNAAMIGLAAYYHILRGDTSNWKNIEVDSNLELK